MTTARELIGIWGQHGIDGKLLHMLARLTIKFMGISVAVFWGSLSEHYGDFFNLKYRN